MKWLARVLLVVAALVTPAYLLLDEHGLIPIAFRDRPWPLALVAVALALASLRVSPRLRVLAPVLALASLGALGWAAHARYRLPPPVDELEGAPLPDLTLPNERGELVKPARSARPPHCCSSGFAAAGVPIAGTNWPTSRASRRASHPPTSAWSRWRPTHRSRSTSSSEICSYRSRCSPIPGYIW